LKDGITWKEKNDLVSQKKSLEEDILKLEQKQNVWLGPLEVWINEAAETAAIADGNDLKEKRFKP